MKQIEERNLEDSLEVYNSIMQDLYDRIGVDQYERKDSRFFKVAKFIELISRNLTAEERLEKMLNADLEVEKRKQLLKDKIYGK